MVTKDAKIVSFSVPGDARAAGVARRAVTSSKAGLPEIIRHRVALLLSELVTNAVQHGGGPHELIEVRLVSTSKRVRVEVHDSGNGGSMTRGRLEEDHGGYGLLLVDHLADSWGREHTDHGGTVAWFELDTEGLAGP